MGFLNDPMRGLGAGSKEERELGGGEEQDPERERERERGTEDTGPGVQGPSGPGCCQAVISLLRSAGCLALDPCDHRERGLEGLRCLQCQSARMQPELLRHQDLDQGQGPL